MSSGNFVVDDAESLNIAIVQVDSDVSGNYTIDLTANITLASDLDAISLAPGVSLTIDGNTGGSGSYTLSGGGAYQGFFVYAGNVTLENLSISDGVAKGGAGGTGGGGGAGLGGGLFVAGTTAGAGAGGRVTLNNVGFFNDSAVGGAGGQGGEDLGGGGGLGGAGGSANYDGEGGGGGGIGSSASGGSSSKNPRNGNAGIIRGAAGGGSAGGSGAGGGGISGGGGGAGGGRGGGGGGGIAGVGGLNLNHGYKGGAGGFGGGGGGGFGTSGNGGFGGGGGGSEDKSGQGGFGGGGGGNGQSTVGAEGGFGAGTGGHAETFTYAPSTSYGVTTSPGGTYLAGNGGGGGGLGAGGDIFVQQGGSLIIEGGTLGAAVISGGVGGAGVGGSSGGSGASFGSSIFLQGNQTLALAAATGSTLVVSGSIDDENGSVAGYSADQSSIIVDSGTVELMATSDYTGGTTIEDGALILGAPEAAGSGNITFGTGDPPGLTFALADAPSNVIDNFITGDTIEITDLAVVSPVTLTLSGSDILSETIGGQTLNLTFSAADSDALFTLTSDDVGGAILTDNVPCFAAGTRILTPLGDVAVEDLRVGDNVITVREDGGPTAEIVWTGRRSLDVARHADPASVRPVRICAGAFGLGIPESDLLLSPHHAVYIDGALFEAIALVNGITIRQDQTIRYLTYHHIELAQHDIVLAEGLAAESFLDTGNRGMFETETGAMRLHPDWRTPKSARTCVPLHREGERVEKMKARLLALVENSPARLGVG